MTGRDLIVYILKNDLEDTDIFKNGKIYGFLTIKEAAAKLGVGTATILVWYALDEIEGFYASLPARGAWIEIPKNIKDPRSERTNK